MGPELLGVRRVKREIPSMNIPGTDEDLSRALNDVNLPNLLLVLASITGSDEWLAERFKPAPVEAPEGSMFPDDTGCYDESIATEFGPLLSG